MLKEIYEEQWTMASDSVRDKSSYDVVPGRLSVSMSNYASGKHAFGFCDRTGFRYKLKDLVPQIENGRPNGMLVGRDVVDKDNPQWKLGMINMSDPQALRNPRPDGGFFSKQRAFSF